jgi:ATP-dependent DNA helicase DinG
MTRRQADIESGSPEIDQVFGPGGCLADTIPEFESRPGQRKMAEAVSRAIRTGEILLAEAGTGTGKTLAYLVPALLSGKKTLVSTGTKTLQDQLFLKDIPLLARALPFAFATAVMKGRGNYLCVRSLRRVLAERHTRAERAALTRIQQWSAVSARGDRAELDFLSDTDAVWNDLAAWSDACIGSACEDFDRCFLTRMRQEAAAADLVIVNHHLLMADAALRDSSMFHLIPPAAVLILDEAHLLEDIATEFFGSEISNARIERLVRDAQREWVGLAREDPSFGSHLMQLAEACGRFFGALPVPEGTQRLRPESLDGWPASAGRALREALILLHDLIAALPGKPEGLLACARRAQEHAAVLGEFLQPPGAAGPAVVRWTERRSRSVHLRASPLDVSDEFRRTILESVETVVLTSATLTTGGEFQFLRSRLGVDRAHEFQAASPFDYGEQTILYLPRHLPDPRDPAFLPEAAAEIQSILTLSGGRGLVLFTSVEAMEATHRLLQGTLPFPLLLQGEAPRTELLDRFRRDVLSVLLATRSFWQGVDVMGEALSCVIIHKLPFGYPGEPVLQARLEHLASQGQDPFWEYQVPSAVIALRQGLGRLIRSGRDRGALCILDGRLQSRSYGRAFLDSLPPCPVTEDRRDLVPFFAAPEPSAP